MVHPRARLAFFVPATKSFAGIEQVTHQLATALAVNHGDRVEVIVFYGAEYEDAFLRDTAYTSRHIGSQHLRDIPLTLGRALRREPVDVLVCPQVTAGTLSRIAAVGCDIPVFLTHIHGNVEVESVSSPANAAMFFAFAHVVSRFVTAVLAVSPTQALHAERMGLSKAPIRFTKNPVRIFADVTPTPRDDGVYRFVNVAGLTPRKGQSMLLDAFAKVHAARPEARLALVGRGGDEAMLRERARAAGIEAVVEFCGYAGDPSVHYRRSDCFVLSSRDEGFGLVLVEALSCGLPIVSTDCLFGPADIVTDTRAGTLVPVGDAETMARAMSARMDIPNSEDDRRFRRGVASSYHPDAAAVMFLDVLRSIVVERVPVARRGRFASLVDDRDPHACGAFAT
jgi:glycosyltransferase involved in cell wall biosynthesis